MSVSIENPYKILGIKDNASLEECTAAYKKLAKKYHPDLNPDDYIATEAMKQINAAYDTIKNGSNTVNGETQNNYNKQTETGKNQAKDSSNKQNDKVYNFYAISKSKVSFVYRFIFSIILSFVFGYFLFLIMIPNMPNTYGMIGSFLKMILGDGEPLFGMFKVNFHSLETVLHMSFYSFFNITDVALVVAVSSIFIIFLMSIPYNFLYIRAVTYLEKNNGKFVQDTNKVEKVFNPVEKLNKIFQVSSYVSLALYAIAITLLAIIIVICVISPSWFIAMSVLYLVATILLIPIGVSKKKKRLQGNIGQDFNENIDTYLKNLLYVALPYLIVTCIPVVILLFVLWLISLGARRD